MKTKVLTVKSYNKNKKIVKFESTTHDLKEICEEDLIYGVCLCKDHIAIERKHQLKKSKKIVKLLFCIRDINDTY